MNSSANKYDALESLIYQEGLRIETLDFHPEKDLLLVALNTKVVLQQKLSAYLQLRNASDEELRHYELIGGGTGVHWPQIDEDLSLKGFLKDALKNLVLGSIQNGMAA